MNNKDIIAKIKAEIERLKEKAERRPHATPLEGFECMGKIKVCNELLSFLDSLESEKPEKGIDVTDFCKPIDPGIAQCIADHSWEMLGEDEKHIPKDLEEAAKKYATEWHENPDGSAWKPYFEVSAIKAFIAGAKWQADHTPLPEDTVLFNKGVAEGRRLAEEEQADLFTIVALDAAQRAREQMLKEAVEGEVESFSDMHQEVTIPLNPTMFKVGDKVRIIILPKED